LEVSLPATEEQKTYGRAYYWANRERVLAGVAAYKHANSGKVKTAQREYGKVHRAEISTRNAEYYRRNCVTIRRRIAKHRHEHLVEHRERDRIRAIVNNPNRRAHLIGMPGNLSLTQWEAIKRAYGGRCSYCGTKPRKLTIDRVIPISRGGGTVPENIVPACGFCNTSKGNREAPVLPAVRLMI